MIDVVENPNNIMDLNEHEIKEALERTIPLLKKEKALIELDNSIAFVGDIHGDFETTKAIIKKFFNVDHLVFLGDYIDREPMKWGSIYTITYLLHLKYYYPEKIILLKGNHECNYAIQCFPYEFEQEIMQRFGSTRLHDTFIEVFSSIPLMVRAHNVFGAHGGILKGVDLKTLRTIEKNDVQAIASLVWSDPDVSPTFRGVGNQFNKEDLIAFLDGIDARVFIRGHDYNILGISIFGDRCLTIFSSRLYKDMGNGGILVARTEKAVSSVRDLNIDDFSSGKWTKYKVGRM